MKVKMRWLSILLVLSLCLVGCSNNKSNDNNATNNEANNEANNEPNNEADNEVTPTPENYVELALNVYYNDADSGYYNNEKETY